jgi:hypothetical protein
MDMILGWKQKILKGQKKYMLCRCNDLKKKGIMNEVKNGSKIKMLMHIIGFWVFIIFHECA